MSVPQGAMQSLMMLQAALTAAQPGVTDVTVHGQSQMPGQQPGGGGNSAANMGAMAGGLTKDLMSGGGINPTKNELELAMMGGTLGLPGELQAAQDEYMENAAQYQNTKQRRFRGALGGAEAIYDLVMSKKTRKDMLESRGKLQTETVKYKQLQQQQMVDQEMKRREEYVKNALPLIMYNEPNLPHQAALAMATQAAAQNMPIDKLMPEGAPPPVAEKYIDETTGAEMTRFRNPVNGAIMTSENYKPFMSKGPTETSKASGNHWMKEVAPDGAEYNVLYAPFDQATGQMPELTRVMTKPAAPVGEDVEPPKQMAAMAGEQRNKLGLTATAATNFTQSVPLLFDETGDFYESSAIPGTAARNNLVTLHSGVSEMLRAETGAQKSDEEIAEMAWRFVPHWTDSDITARAKVERLWTKIRTQHAAFTDGYDMKSMDPSLWLPEATLPWEMSEDLAVEIADQDLSYELEQALAAAEEQRRKMEQEQQ